MPPDPARSLLVEASAADRGFAARLGIPAASPELLLERLRAAPPV